MTVFNLYTLHTDDANIIVDKVFEHEVELHDFESFIPQIIQTTLDLGYSVDENLVKVEVVGELSYHVEIGGELSLELVESGVDSRRS